jgi:uncharacterized protein (TIGR03118 family)
MKRLCVRVASFLCFSIVLLSPVFGQANSYKQTNLVSDTPGMASNTDAKLINPWGIAFVPGQVFWIADNNSGFTTLYDQTGASMGSFVIAPPAGSSNPATPTGVVAPPPNVNFDAGGQASSFIYVTEDGTISGWTGAASTVLTVDNSKIPSPATGAVYKGLTLLQNSTGNFLLATNFRSGKVEVYDTNFHLSTVLGATAFNDPSLPAVPAGSGSPGYAPFGIKALTISGQKMVVVTYALQDSPMHDPLHIAGSGFVDLFNSDGTMARRLTPDSHLNAPWGVVIPPAGFGQFAGDLLVGNFGDGTINAFDLASGNFVDQMKDSTGAVIVNASLWDMVFGAGGQSGDPNTLYITAGLANEAHGLFAAITANTSQGAGTPDFSVTSSTSAVTVAAGQPATFTITVGGLNGFNSAVNFTCSGEPAGTTCTFSPTNVTPASGATAMTTVTIATTATGMYPAIRMASAVKGTSHGLYASLLPLPALGLFSTFVFGFRKNSPHCKRTGGSFLAGSLALLFALGLLLTASGCGYNSSANTMGTPRGTTTVLVTATSGSLSHTASVTLTVQ